MNTKVIFAFLHFFCFLFKLLQTNIPIIKFKRKLLHCVCVQALHKCVRRYAKEMTSFCLFCLKEMQKLDYSNYFIEHKKVQGLHLSSCFLLLYKIVTLLINYCYGNNNGIYVMGMMYEVNIITIYCLFSSFMFCGYDNKTMGFSRI